MQNPLLEDRPLPAFSRIQAEHVVPAIDTLLSQCQHNIDTLLDSTQNYSWESFVQPLNDITDRLDRAWAPVRHLNAVMNNDTLREAYKTCLSKLSRFRTELAQDPRLYQAYKTIAESSAFSELNHAQQKVIQDALRDFRLAGAELDPDRQQRFKILQEELTKLSSQFEDNVLDATHAWQRHIDDVAQLQGLPESVLAMLKQNAEQKQQSGWLLNLEFPCYLGVMTYADNRALRQDMHFAYVTRASDRGPHAGRWDNSELMHEILKRRYESAQLLGFANYAELSLQTKMAPSTDKVTTFLRDLVRRSKPIAQQEYRDLVEFAQQHLGIDDLQPWDYQYCTEKYTQHHYHLSQEELKPYLSEPRVLQGLFRICERLYGIRIEETSQQVERWHQDVRFFDIKDQHDQCLGRFYLDLYARANKQGGAWMDDCVHRKRQGDQVQIPVAFIICNFTPPLGDKAVLFTHSEVITLFHEFGHGLHHMLTQVDYVPVSGINGVPWDAVELPSQFMENWCWQRESLDLFAQHYETDEALPDDLYAKMIAAKNYQSALQMLRQVEFALFDFNLHLYYTSEKPLDIQATLDSVRDEVAVLKPIADNRFQNSFTHIFAGGYAAGYYGYKWAEVLSADAFSRFEETGLFDPQTGQAFLETLLQQGGTRDPLDLFIKFRGREPEIDALLRHCGIAA